MRTKLSGAIQPILYLLYGGCCSAFRHLRELMMLRVLRERRSRTKNLGSQASPQVDKHNHTLRQHVSSIFTARMPYYTRLVY